MWYYDNRGREDEQIFDFRSSMFVSGMFVDGEFFADIVRRGTKI